VKFAAASSATAATPGGGSRTEDAIVPVSERDGVDHADVGTGIERRAEIGRTFAFAFFAEIADVETATISAATSARAYSGSGSNGVSPRAIAASV